MKTVEEMSEETYAHDWAQGVDENARCRTAFVLGFELAIERLRSIEARMFCHERREDYHKKEPDLLCGYVGPTDFAEWLEAQKSPDAPFKEKP